jgi:hypothetical protein
MTTCTAFNPLACQHYSCAGFRSRQWENDLFGSTGSFANKIGGQFIQAVSDVIANLSPDSVGYIHPQSGYSALSCRNGDKTSLVVWGLNYKTDVFWVGIVTDLHNYIWSQEVPKGVDLIHSYPVSQRADIEATLEAWLN